MYVWYKMCGYIIVKWLAVCTLKCYESVYECRYVIVYLSCKRDSQIKNKKNKTCQVLFFFHSLCLLKMC